MATDRLNVLGVGVSPLNLSRAVDVIDDWIARHDRQYVCVTGVHGVMESQRDAAIRRAHNAAGMVTPDGMPLAWLLQLAGYREADRVCGCELMEKIFERSRERRYRHFLYGSTERTLSLLAAKLTARFPAAIIAGTFSPPFRALDGAEESRINRLIDASRPDIVWVGLSTPKQERWMAHHRPALNASVLIGVGAAFDFHAGLLPRAPGLMQRCGMEWLFRMMVEPRRLAGRYLRNNPLFLCALLAQRSGIRKYPIDA